MYEIHGIQSSFNTTKVVYVAEMLGIQYKYTEIDLSKNEQKTPEHLRRHPFGRAPTLTIDGDHLFESGAICRYLASVSASEMYPTDAFARGEVDQWMDFFSVHLGRWLSTLLFERVVRSKFGFGEKNVALEKEALDLAEKQMQSLNSHLDGRPFLTGDNVTIADIFAFAYVETTEMIGFSLDSYPHVKAWYEKSKSAEPIARAKARTAT
jgi:glutathione S-transferase